MYEIHWVLLDAVRADDQKSIANRFGKELAEEALRNGKTEYRRLLSRADDLGPGNPMAMNALESIFHSGSSS